MGWFDEQLRQRKENDQNILGESFVKLSGVVLGNKIRLSYDDDRLIAEAAIDRVLRYYHVRPADTPDNVKTFEEQLECKLRPHGIMKRTVELKDDWYRDAFGPMLAFDKEDKPYALLPDSVRGYSYYDHETGKKVKINKSNAGRFEKNAICFYFPLPVRKLSIRDMLSFMFKRITAGDLALVFLLMLITTGLMMMIPVFTKAMTGNVIRTGSKKALLGIAIFMSCTYISNRFFHGLKNLVENRIGIKTRITMQSAVMMRTLSMPASFFKKYSSGELNKRVQSVNELSGTVLSLIISGGFGSLTSLIYVFQIFGYARVLVIPSLAILGLTLLLTVVTALIQIGIDKKQMLYSAKEQGVSYALVSGIDKIKRAGAEKRAFAKWAEAYSKSATLKYSPPLFIRLNPVFSQFLMLGGGLLLNYLAVKNGIELSNYLAFLVAYGMVSSAFTMLVNLSLSFARITPVLEMARPILETEPEISEKKAMVTRLQGNIELNNVSFRYSETSPFIINDLSLKIKSGEYVAIVGKTGCGKSTLVRLLLGFENPVRGAVYYDGRDIASLDLKSLRSRIGTVLQSGSLFTGDIFSNISISAPQLSIEEAWNAAEIAGIADDIREMPMGMNTLISEGGGGISGGQKQRLMIARAIAPKPKILIFDEATSALDNRTQKKVSDALDALKCTRIVIAHRLSTIRHASRIILLDGGKIAEDGSYEELMAKNGLFAELVERQRLDKE